MATAQPKLQEYPLQMAKDAYEERPEGVLFVTMSPGQWDPLLAAAYHEEAILLEVDQDDQIVRAYMKRQES